ncbi:MAG: hypothetical protein IPM46_10785 [Flavobacteriales bacterium]|nr:hypothetical protein [Flavobacteriales bacterium]
MRSPLLMLAVLLTIHMQASVRTLIVRGTLNNSVGLKALYPAVNLRSVGYLRPASGVDLSTGAFSGELDCELIRNAHGTWVDITLEAFPFTLEDRPTMVIRAPYSRTIDLGTFDWMPSRYRWKNAALVIDTAVPRDTVITNGLQFPRIHLRPVNPAPEDSMVIEFEWPSSGAAHIASYTMTMKDCCTVRIDFTFALRTDVDVYGDSWSQRAKPFALPKLEAGRYRLRQVPAQGENLRDVDFLLDEDFFFTVGERTEP